MRVWDLTFLVSYVHANFRVLSLTLAAGDFQLLRAIQILKLFYMSPIAASIPNPSCSSAWRMLCREPLFTLTTTIIGLAIISITLVAIITITITVSNTTIAIGTIIDCLRLGQGDLPLVQGEAVQRISAKVGCSLSQTLT